MLLAGTAACAAAAWATQIGGGPTPVVLVVANVMITVITLSNRFAGLPRLAGLLVLTLVVSSLLVIPQDGPEPPKPLGTLFSPPFSLLALALLLARDGWIVARTSKGSVGWKGFLIGAALVGLTVYMVVIPSVDAVLEPYRDRPTSYVIEDLTPLEVLRVRSAKFATFAIFAYAGACWGSFLNVAAASLPRGEAIALRSSACPQCQTPIRRIDNLPILSYLRLGGRCHACDVEIPVRYLLVELAGMSIFSLLFLYELVTGAANVPGFPHYHYTGILWIILYTKWPVVGIYLYHCALMCVLLTLAIMECDRQRCPSRVAWILGITFALLPVAVATLLPVRFDRHLPFDISSSLPIYISQSIAVATGAIAGALIGRLASRTRLLRRTKNLSLGFTLIGAGLGWQAVLTIGVLFFSAAWLGSLRIRWRHPIAVGWSAMLLWVVVMIHHPFWKSIDGLW